MFDPTPKDLANEIKEAEKLRDEHIRGVDHILREYTGQWYRAASPYRLAGTGDPYQDDNPDPFSYSFVTNVLPSLIYTNPAVRVKARRVIGHRMVADAMKSGLTGLMPDIGYADKVERVVMDTFFFHGVLMHYLEDDERWSSGAVRPNVMRIDFRMWGCDSLASIYEDAAFAFHSYYANLEDLQADPEVLPEALQRLKPNNEGDDRNQGSKLYQKGKAENLKRNRVKLYSVWSREKNTIRILTMEPEGMEVYAEREYYGPKSGPYVLYQGLPVPDQVYPLAPLVAVHDQVRDLQAHARSAARSAAGRKTIFIVDGTVNDLEDKVYSAEDREVIAVPGFNAGQIQQIDLGGVTREQYEYLSLLRQRLDMHSGLNEVARGNVGASETATEASIAQSALSNRIEYLKNKVHKATIQSLNSLGWFLFNTPGIIIPVTRKDELTGFESDALFFGGVQEGEDSGQWEDFELSIEPYSMARVSEAMVQRRAMDLMNLVMQVAPAMPQMPWVDWMSLVRMIGESFNYTDADKLFIPQVLQMLGLPMMGTGMDPMGPGSYLGGDAPPDRYSIPGQGFKNTSGGVRASPNSNATLGVDEMRSEMNQDFGRMYGGTQRAPGRAVV